MICHVLQMRSGISINQSEAVLFSLRAGKSSTTVKANMKNAVEAKALKFVADDFHQATSNDTTKINDGNQTKASSPSPGSAKKRCRK